ncbi:uncharacterized protein LOC106084853 [Stomoxys calcitrans]|uniref:Uncharacterized protein n=1 Tax=Stomoxys calcitrans TaxID=35570 RepID=A0A1I8Q258_STOCA|nr:uncharacterized protein LOC106084853 [Stomoxys calcitrans]
MKCFVLILSIVAIMRQVSSAEFLGGIKRTAAEELVGTISAYTTKLAADSGVIIKSILEELPQTDAFHKYREELDEFLQEYDKYKSVKGPCFDKSKELLGILNETIVKYYSEDAPAEAKKIVEIFHSSPKYRELTEYDEKIKSFANRDWTSSEMEEIDAKLSDNNTAEC